MMALECACGRKMYPDAALLRCPGCGRPTATMGPCSMTSKPEGREVEARQLAKIAPTWAMVAAARQEGTTLDLDTCPECHQPYDGAACVHSEGCALGLWEYEDQDFYTTEGEQQAMRVRDREHYRENPR